MSFLTITGRRPLSGSLTVQGAKNSVLPILAACVLVPGECVLHNCPDLSDVRSTLAILQGLGCRVRREGSTVCVDASGVEYRAIPPERMRQMRSSFIFFGAILGRVGEAALGYPGGCELGPRPIDLHLEALRALGAQIWEENSVVFGRGGSCLRGAAVHLPFPSVGATENAMLVACACSGDTVITGAAQEPEIEDLQAFLNAAGAVVRGAGTDRIVICGARPLHGTQHRVMSDRIVAATCLAAVGAAGGQARLQGVSGRWITPVTAVLEQAGCCIEQKRDGLYIRASRPMGDGGFVRTAPYPGFPTDAQAVVMAALAAGAGESCFEETMFQSRYRHVPELGRMGADIRVDGRRALVRGRPLHAAQVESTDLRGGAALVVAALAAEGTSRVGALHHIDRGYECVEEMFARLGAQIRREDTQEEVTPCRRQEENEIVTAGAAASALSISCWP
ncbi:MAG: UDP-N-acetylglucosamine 1-carboxyvinyltransferase [Oscillospiraceae bacterium]|nr:UDP-N-acetylglucosamine 1-carboxyvinyltransferase [Oscillospiraceae bacterium]